MSVDYIESLSRKHYEAIGFLPRPRLEAYEHSGQVAYEYENGELCGFLVWGKGWPILRIFQACIQYDAQRREHGFSLVRRLIQRADAEGYESITLWCAEDLAANEFWKACGFTWTAQRDGGMKRGRKHNLWVFRCHSPVQGLLLTEGRDPIRSISSDGL